MAKRRLRITVLDLAGKGRAKRLYQRVMNANQATIMPQVISAWCEELGHEVRYVCYTGFEDFAAELRDPCDVLFVSAYTQSALTAYAVSNLYRQAGAVTVLGGPHARCYPEDAARYFDYVLGFTDKTIVDDVLHDLAPHRPEGVYVSAAGQPAELPSLEQRWKFVAANLEKARFLKIVPMIGSMGCPYTCSFCIDSTVGYQPLAFDQIRADLRFLRGKVRRPMVGWHDPNFGVRFDDYMTAIEDAVPEGGMRFIAESSLALLSEPHLKRLKRNGFVGILPGIESWYDLGNKSKTGRAVGIEKVRRVAEHVNTILRYIPYVQTNFVLGLDCDAGAEPFELSKRFIDLVPGAYPAYSLMTAYGAAAPLNLELQRAGRVLPIPFRFLDGIHAMNVRPLHYEWAEFYAHLEDLTQYLRSPARLAKRFGANRGLATKSLNLIRAASSHRVRYNARIGTLLQTDASFRGFFDGKTDALPDFYAKKVKRHLGTLWESLPEGALAHDPNAYLKRHEATLRRAAE
ncbi:MAG TPA: cobalamin-dependent protein [Candidatus Cybelea sp.]|nr:cobalamin-dependent protein [Candidatus Cybelea sp.]